MQALRRGVVHMAGFSTTVAVQAAGQCDSQTDRDGGWVCYYSTVLRNLQNMRQLVITAGGEFMSKKKG